jgi:hypothetical protein
MVLIPAGRARLQNLLAALPTLESGTELILRPDADQVTATLRRDGTPPRVFTETPTGIVELVPEADPGLPGARLLASAAELQALLRPHVGTIAETKVVAWRPARRAVVRVTAADGTVHWLKFLDERSHRRACRAFAALGRSVAPMHLVSPSHYFASECAWLAPCARGTSLRSRIAQGDTLPLTTIASGLAALAYTETNGDLPVFDFARARKAAVDVLDKAAVMRPELADLAEAVGRLVDPAPPEHQGFVHGDLHDKQLFVTDTGVSLIDLEGMALGDPRFDLSNLAEHVRLRDLQQTGEDSGIGDVVLARCGLLPTAPATQLFRTVVRARLCGVYALRPRWRPLVDRLVRETRTLMEQLP